MACALLSLSRRARELRLKSLCSCTSDRATGKNRIFHDSRSWSKSPKNSFFGLRASPQSACAILGSTPWRESLAGPPRATSTAQRHRRDYVPDGPHTLSTEGVSHSVARAPRASRAPACAILGSTQRREALAGPHRATSTAQRRRRDPVSDGPTHTAH